MLNLSDHRFNLTIRQVQNPSIFQQGQPILHKGAIHPWEHGSQFAQGPRCRSSDPLKHQKVLKRILQNPEKHTAKVW